MMQRLTALPRQAKASSITSVRFQDGMVVTAEDMQAAMDYPALMLQVVLRSYFGCGVISGLQLQPDPRARKADTFTLAVGGGTAIDCNGFPLELPGQVKLDLGTDECEPDSGPVQLFIAIRRARSNESARRACACGTGDAHLQCTRVQEHVLIQAMTLDQVRGLGSLCRQREPASHRTGEADEVEAGRDRMESDRSELCRCLTAESECVGGEESWVLLGSVRVGDDGITSVSNEERRYVKPIECHCGRSRQRPPDVVPGHPF